MTGWRTPSALRLQALNLPSSGNRLLGFLRQVKANNVRGRIQIIVARLVDHAHVAVFLRFFVWDHAVDLARFKVVARLVVHAQDESAVCLFSTHVYASI